MFAPFFGVPAGARVLDCACGIGLLAIGLAQAGYRAEASDISPAMVARTRALASQRGVDLDARVSAWVDLEPGPRYDAVFCVGNSLGHVRDRMPSLRAIVATLNPGGQLLVTSRNWEREGMEQPRYIDVDVAGVRERLTYWPFTYAALKADLTEADLSLVHSTYSPDAERYLLAAQA
jgi:2-polyprenyl-3-methyl-5-hydroxy-6-metoxy-1,4-benzoquinol methylase